MDVWIIRTYDIKGCVENIEVAITAIDAYNYCHNYINHLNFDSEYDSEMCLRELANSYSESRSNFGIDSLINAKRQPIIEGFKSDLKGVIKWILQLMQ